MSKEFFDKLAGALADGQFSPAFKSAETLPDGSIRYVYSSKFGVDEQSYTFLHTSTGSVIISRSEGSEVNKLVGSHNSISSLETVLEKYKNMNVSQWGERMESICNVERAEASMVYFPKPHQLAASANKGTPTPVAPAR